MTSINDADKPEVQEMLKAFFEYIDKYEGYDFDLRGENLVAVFREFAKQWQRKGVFTEVIK